MVEEINEPARAEPLPFPIAAPIYTYEVAAVLSATGITLAFGRQKLVLSPQGDPLGTNSKEWHTAVAMSPETAKLVLTVLQSLLEVYEQQFGPVRNLSASFKVERQQTGSAQIK